MPASKLRNRCPAPKAGFAARIIVPLALAMALATGAHAAALAGTTVMGAGPAVASAGPIRHVAASGTTKPDGAAVDARLGTSPRLARRSLEIGREIRMAICAGC